MTWVTVTLHQWTCDGCGTKEALADDRQPDRWIHTMDGRDLCGDCQP